MRPDCGRCQGSGDELAPLGLDTVPRRPIGGLDAGEGRHRSSTRPELQLRDILSIGLVQIIGQVSRGFTNDEQFHERAKGLDLTELIPPDRARHIAREALPIYYATWHRFFRHIVNRHGRERFQEFLVAYLSDPASYEGHFTKTYGYTLMDAAAEFEEAVRNAQV